VTTYELPGYPERSGRNDTNHIVDNAFFRPYTVPDVNLKRQGIHDSIISHYHFGNRDNQDYLRG
jgi:hypothetical protein